MNHNMNDMKPAKMPKGKGNANAYQGNTFIRNFADTLEEYVHFYFCACVFKQVFIKCFDDFFGVGFRFRDNCCWRYIVLQH